MVFVPWSNLLPQQGSFAHGMPLLPQPAWYGGVVALRKVAFLLAYELEATCQDYTTGLGHALLPAHRPLHDPAHTPERRALERGSQAPLPWAFKLSGRCRRSKTQALGIKRSTFPAWDCDGGGGLCQPGQARAGYIDREFSSHNAASPQTDSRLNMWGLQLTASGGWWRGERSPSP